MITSQTRVAGVIGSPVRHSLSPAIHNAAFGHLQLDWVYAAFEVQPASAAAVVEAVRTLGLAGLNVTMPHKEVVAGAADRLTPVAEALGAVNCLFWDGADLVGDNTDGEGFVDALRMEAGRGPEGLACAVVGAGGAGRAVAWALGRSGATEVVVVNRHRGRAERAAALAGGAGRVGEPAELATVDLVVNATPLGMGSAGEDGDDASLPFDPSLLHDGHVVVDLIYHPATTPLLEAARQRGAEAYNGLGMLVHQAGRSFTRWTGQSPPISVMTSAVSRALAGG